LPYVEPQLNRRFDLLDILPPGTGSAQKILVQFRIVDRQGTRNLDQHRGKLGMILCSLSFVVQRCDGSGRGMCGMAKQLDRHVGAVSP
jgi:hypothetical protein